MLLGTMRFFDAHCDTITKIWERKADFTAGGHGTLAGDTAAGALHVTLPGLQSAGVCAQVFASWVWTERYKGRELEVGLEKVETVRRLCDDHPGDLFFARTGAELRRACECSEQPGGQSQKTAVIASLEGADPLLGDVDNLALFHRAGVRLLTLAWGDNAFCGSVFGNGGGLTSEGVELVAACEEQHVLLDVSHASDQAFADICRLATRPFVASHSNCRAICPSPRNLTDEMIRAVAERGGVMGINLAPAFLSRDYLEKDQPMSDDFFRAISAGTESFEEAERRTAAAMAKIPRPPLELIVDHVRHAIDVGGEDAVGLGGDLDGIDTLPAGFDGVDDYPRIAELLEEAGLPPAQVEKVCYGNLARVFKEVLE
jgi:membrane dipeptidase